MHNLQAFENEGGEEVACISWIGEKTKDEDEIFSFKKHSFPRLSSNSWNYFSRKRGYVVPSEIIDNCRFLSEGSHRCLDLMYMRCTLGALTGWRGDESASSFTIGLVRFVDTKMSIARRLNLCKHASRSCSWISGIDGGTLGRGNSENGQWNRYCRSILDTIGWTSSWLNFYIEFLHWKYMVYRIESLLRKFEDRRIIHSLYTIFSRNFLFSRFSRFSSVITSVGYVIVNFWLIFQLCDGRITPTDRSLLSLLYISTLLGNVRIWRRGGLAWFVDSRNAVVTLLRKARPTIILLLSSSIN